MYTLDNVRAIFALVVGDIDTVSHSVLASESSGIVLYKLNLSASCHAGQTLHDLTKPASAAAGWLSSGDRRVKDVSVSILGHTDELDSGSLITKSGTKLHGMPLREFMPVRARVSIAAR